MSDSRLRDLLARLRSHLSAGPPVPDAQRAQLDNALKAIEPGAEPGAPAAGTLLRLERMAVRFEVSHPALAETLREIADTLGKGGL
ncbi:MAG TPA: DUF4404 family protein [Steroidobacteraceae bacterium]|nr:DUF4404 family protein [Steroidobacteraceae bacterium]